MAITVAKQDGNASVRGELSYDPTRRTLAYSVRVTGVPANDVLTLSIDVDSAGRKGAMVRHLAGRGIAAAKNTLTLTDFERRELLAGQLSLVAYTRERPSGTLRAAIQLHP